MQLSIFSLAALLLSGIDVSVQLEARDTQMCAVCHRLAEKVEDRMKDTESRANEEISIGARIGPSGESIPKTIITYGNSERRLLDVLEGVCIGSPNTGKCNELLHNQDSLINNWFHEGRDKSFSEFVCGSAYQGCNADVASQYWKRLEQDEEAQRKREQEEEEARQRKAEEDRKSKKESSSKSPQQETKQSEKKKEEGEGMKGPADLIMAFVNRVKNNMLRLKSLSGEMYGEVSTVVKAKDWNKLKLMIKDPNFYRKYWNVLLWVVILAYTIASTIASFFASPPPKRERRAAPSKRKVSSKSGSSKSGAKDE